MKPIGELRGKLSFSAKRKTLRQVAKWKGLFRPDGQREYFRGWENMPGFDPGQENFSPSNAWWMAELCRISYTPDHRESSRKWNEDKPDRKLILEERSPFQEILSIHKTGNHAAIYRWKSESGQEGTVLCFRGTKKLRQWIMNMLFRPHNWERFRKPHESDTAFVHSGFYVFFKLVWPLLQEELERCPRPWVFTGHSLGGALATIASVVGEPDSLYTFGSPKPGNPAFAKLMPEALHYYRITNRDDVVPWLPLPDGKLGEREFDHGGEHFWLDESSTVVAGNPNAQSADKKLPFTLEFSSDKLEKPPTWIQDHLIGRYCRRLRKSSLTSDH